MSRGTWQLCGFLLLACSCRARQDDKWYLESKFQPQAGTSNFSGLTEGRDWCRVAAPMHDEATRQLDSAKIVALPQGDRRRLCSAVLSSSAGNLFLARAVEIDPGTLWLEFSSAESTLLTMTHDDSWGGKGMRRVPVVVVLPSKPDHALIGIAHEGL